MNNDMLAGDWMPYRAKILARWPQLTEADVDSAAGRRAQLGRKIQERYGIAKAESEQQMKDFEDLYTSAVEG